jgi:hypothetical protein
MTEIIKITLPAIIVAASCLFLIVNFLKNEQKKLVATQKQENTKTAIGLKLQAYERIILFLERIHPRNSLLRFNLQDANALQLQKELIGAIRQEFDHNITQQLYVSNEAWSLVKSAKESVLMEINKTASGLATDATATELAARLLETEAGNPPQVNVAILFIKKEAQDLF